MKRRPTRFGGEWTEQKLDMLGQYLGAYTTALKNQTGFEKWYIDAFAGTGYRAPRGDQDDELQIFPELAEEEPQKFLEGSAKIALKTDPPFDRYIFVEQGRIKCQHLEALKLEFPHLATRIEVKERDANEYIQEIAKQSWVSRRAVLFLDPYGMQVAWDTILAISRTQAIDLWYLFPLGAGVNRLLRRDSNIPEVLKTRITFLLGSEEWREAFYKTKKFQSILGDEEEEVSRVTIDDIGAYFVRRLKSVFPYVAPNPYTLRNRKNSPLYLFCFAAANPGKGGEIALRIARYILQG